MAAKPRVTLRLAPETLHALAFVAVRDGLPPAELARMLLQAQLAAVLAARGLGDDCRAHWRAWLAEQAGQGGRPESPSQDDYDELARGALASGLEPAPVPSARPLSAVLAAADATLLRVQTRLASRTARS